MAVLGMGWLGWLNFVVLQWFGVRLARVRTWKVGYGHKYRYHWMTRILPLTGWWSDYRSF